eukprot:SAG11_NODE_3764_length_2243_cov_1.413246_2_plen_20_part_01
MYNTKGDKIKHKIQMRKSRN